MNRELEDLVVAFDHWRSACEGSDAERLKAIYFSRFEEVCTRCPKIPKENLQRAIEHQHLLWVRANRKPTTLPPKA